MLCDDEKHKINSTDVFISVGINLKQFHVPGNMATLDQRLRPGGVGQQLHLPATEVNAVQAFLRTLAGNKIYTDSRWGNPFK